MFCCCSFKNVSSLLTVIFIFINKSNIVFGRSIIESSTCQDSAKLSSSYPSSDIGKIELINHLEKNFISSVDGSYQSLHGTGTAKSFTVKMTIYNTGCTGIEEIIIDLYGERIANDVDNVFVMSLENNNGNTVNTQYFSVINDWDNKLVINGVQGGVFMSPPSGGNLLTENKINLIDNMFNGINNYLEYRDRLSAGDSNDFTLLNNGEPIGTSTSPLRYHIKNHNEGFGNYIDFTFIHNGKGETRTFTQSFDTSNNNNDYIIGIGADSGRPKYDKFDVTVKCYEYTFAS